MSDLRPPKSMTSPVNQILCGDAAELMRGRLPEESVHAIVTDPPYGLEFMGEEWDKFKDYGISGFLGKSLTKQASAKYVSIGRGRQMEGCGFDKKAKPSFYNISKHGMLKYQQWTTAWAREALRVLVPGASMLVMGGTRTYHRMACGVEDAGFEVKDTVLWCYNSGFPKAQDLGKMIDRRLGVEGKREIIGKYISPRQIEKGTFKDEFPSGTYEQSKNKVCYGEYAGKKERFDITIPATPLAREWDGWKVGGLKPSYEPVVWAVKPPEGSYVENVLKHGVGAIDIEACRIPYEGDDDRETARYNALGMERLKKDYGEELGTLFEGGWKKHKLGDQPQGRYPANMVRTDRFEDGYDRFYFVPKADRGERDEGLEGMPEVQRSYMSKESRVGKCIHASKGMDRFTHKLRNTHPTVKPVRLMEHLIKLVTRLDQVVLDPFVGSGTTCIAARRLRRRWIGFDNNREYCEIARRRLAAIPPPLEVFA